MMIKKYENNGHIIHHGDAIEILRSEIGDTFVDLIFVDPPYNIGKKFSQFRDRWPSEAEYAKWAYEWIDECVRILKPTGTMYLMSSTQAMPYFDLYSKNRGNNILQSSEIIQYLNIKTKAANRGSKLRAGFANHYGIYVLIEDYLNGGFDSSTGYSDYEGAKFSDLFRRQRELPFGSKL